MHKVKKKIDKEEQKKLEPNKFPNLRGKVRPNNFNQKMVPAAV